MESLSNMRPAGRKFKHQGWTHSHTLPAVLITPLRRYSKDTCSSRLQADTPACLCRSWGWFSPSPTCWAVLVPRAASANPPLQDTGAQLWEGTQPGQLTHTGQRHVPKHMTIKGEGGVGTFVIVGLALCRLKPAFLGNDGTLMADGK